MDPGIIIALISVLGAGGLAAILKVAPQRANIMVRSAEKMVFMQSGELGRVYLTVDKLNEQIVKMETRIEHCEELEVRVVGLERESKGLREQRDRLQTENEKLRERVAHLEEKVASLQNRE